MASRVSIDSSYFDSLIFETRLACCASEHVSKKRRIEKETNNIVGMKIEFDKNKAIPWWRVMKNRKYEVREEEVIGMEILFKKDVVSWWYHLQWISWGKLYIMNKNFE